MSIFNIIKKTEPIHSLEFPIVGMSYYVADLIAIAEPNKEYNYSDRQLLDLGRSKVYRYHFIIKDVKLVLEPKNKADKNAIMVVVNGRRIGYVPADKTGLVKPMLKKRHKIYIDLHGGEWRERYGEIYEKKSYTYYGDITIELI